MSVRIPETIARLFPESCEPLYAIPQSMLDGLESRSRAHLLSGAALNAEHELTEHCCTEQIVGYSHGWSVRFDLLDDPDRKAQSVRALVEEFAEMRGDPPPSRRTLMQFQLQSAGIKRAQRGYAGWLVTNQRYRQELRQVQEKWSPPARRFGLPMVGTLWHAPKSFRKSKYRMALAAFFERWQLEGLASFELPVPMGPELPVVDPKPMIARMRACGTTLFLPDTFPVPSREEIRSIGLNVQAQRADAHLRDWINIVRREGNRTGVARFGQLLAVHFCWAIVRSRYSNLVKRNAERIDAAVGQYVNCAPDTVRRFRRLIGERLGGPPTFR